MRYQVDWTPSAIGQLATLWPAAMNRSAVTASEARIDRDLGRDPRGIGTLVIEGLYRYRLPPLQVMYEVNDTTRVVTVTAVFGVP